MWINPPRGSDLWRFQNEADGGSDVHPNLVNWQKIYDDIQEEKLEEARYTEMQEAREARKRQGAFTQRREPDHVEEAIADVERRREPIAGHPQEHDPGECWNGGTECYECLGCGRHIHESRYGGAPQPENLSDPYYFCSECRAQMEE